MSRRNRREEARKEQTRHQAREQETQAAQQAAQQQAQQRGPLVDLQDADPAELLDKLLDKDLEGRDHNNEWEGLEDLTAPYLSAGHMLSSHDDGEYYDDFSQELLNENLADRLIATRERGQHLTGEYLEIARDVEHEQGATQTRPLGPSEKEAVRNAIEKVRTDRQSLGDGTLLKAITEMHVSSEVRRDDESEEESGSLVSTLNPF